MSTFNLEEFQRKLKEEKKFSSSIINRSDIIDGDNGTMLVYKENLNKYLEKYLCKDADDLSDTLWQSYGIFVTVAE